MADAGATQLVPPQFILVPRREFRTGILHPEFTSGRSGGIAGVARRLFDHRRRPDFRSFRSFRSPRKRAHFRATSGFRSPVTSGFRGPARIVQESFQRADATHDVTAAAAAAAAAASAT